MIPVYIVSTDCSNQSCIFDDLQSLKNCLIDEFEFSEKETEKIIEIMVFTDEYEISNSCGYNIKINKKQMTIDDVNNLPEFNGW